MAGERAPQPSNVFLSEKLHWPAGSHAWPAGSHAWLGATRGWGEGSMPPGLARAARRDRGAEALTDCRRGS